MKNKIAIRLKNNGNNYLSFEEVTEIIPETNCVTINDKNYKKLINKEDVNLTSRNINKDEDLYLVLDLDKLVAEALKEGATEENAKAVVKRNLAKLAYNIEQIKPDFADDVLSLTLSFVKEKKMEINIQAIDPDVVIDKIKEKVVAQDEIVEKVVRYIHRNQMIIETQTDEEIERKKGNLIIDGPTGTGKTYIMKQVARNMKLPIVITQATAYTSTGYRGVELQKMLVELLKVTDGDLEAAQRGIIVMDEFDKLGNGKADSPLEIRKAVQEDLLTYMSGAKYSVEYKGKSYDFDTSKITFVCLGAFTDYREKQKENLDETGNYQMQAEDYMEAGIMREMVGRFKVMASTKKYSVAALKSILTDSTASPIRDLITTGNTTYNTNIIFDDLIIDQIAEYAYNLNTGARALQTVISDIENTILKELEDNRKKGGENDLLITPEIMQKATSRYEVKEEDKGAITK